LRLPLAAAGLLTLIAGTAGATDLRVGVGGAGDYDTINEALLAANSGDVILIAAGTYAEDLELDQGRILTVQGEQAETTIIQGSGLGPVVTIGSSGSGITLRGLTLTGGVDDGGYGGCLTVDGSSPIIEDVITHGCEAAYGGCIALLESSAQLTNLVVHSCVAKSNNSSGEFGYGGGVYARGGSPTLTGLRVRGNQAQIGGAVMLYDVGTPTLRDSWVHDNTAPFGAGVVGWAGTVATLSRVAITDNRHCGGGGLLSFQGAEMAVSGSTIARNRLNPAIMACAGEDASGGGVDVNEGQLSLTASAVVSNNAGEGVGGGILVREVTSELDVHRCIIEGNTAELSAGVLAHQDAESATLDRCRVTGNVAGISGGGARLEVPDGLVTGVLFDGNRSTNFAGDLSIDSTSAVPGVRVRNNILYGGWSAQGGGLVVQGAGVEITSNTIHAARSTTAASGSVHLTEVADDGVSGTFANNIVSSSDGTFDLYAGGMSGGLSFTISYGQLQGGTTGALGGGLSGASPAQTDYREPNFLRTDLQEGWDDFLRLDEGPGSDDGDSSLGDDPDGTDTDRGAFGGSGALVWENGDEDGDGVTVWGGDCNDDDPVVNPDASEVCNCRDDDCDYDVDEGCAGDGFCYSPSEGDDDDSVGDDDDSAGDDDDSAGFAPAAGCLVRCDASGEGSSPLAVFSLLLLAGWRRRRPVARSPHE
jgi:uncharacterized protein (TIGR03382 family)